MNHVRPTPPPPLLLPSLQPTQPAILFMCICREEAKHRVTLVSGNDHVTIEGRNRPIRSGALTSLRMAHTAESLSTESRSAITGLKDGSTAPSATPFSKWPERPKAQGRVRSSTFLTTRAALGLIMATFSVLGEEPKSNPASACGAHYIFQQISSTRGIGNEKIKLRLAN